MFGFTYTIVGWEYLTSLLVKEISVFPTALAVKYKSFPFLLDEMKEFDVTVTITSKYYAALSLLKGPPILSVPTLLMSTFLSWRNYDTAKCSNDYFSLTFLLKDGKNW